MIASKLHRFRLCAALHALSLLLALSCQSKFSTEKTTTETAAEEDEGEDEKKKKKSSGPSAEAVEDDAEIFVNQPPEPGASGTITVSNLSYNTLTLTWTKSTDDATDAASLQYEVRRAAVNSLSTVSDAEANGSIEAAYAADIGTVNISGLTQGVTYYFNVIVKDGEDSKAVYTTVSATTLSNAAPTVGGAGAIVVSNLSFTTLTLTWTKATDDQTGVGALQYEIRRSASNNMSNVTDAENASIQAAYATDIGTANLTGLSQGTTYYFNVIVKDNLTSKSVYTTVSATTLSDSTAPTAGGGSGAAITVSNLADVSLTLTWNKATDNVIAQSAIEYEVRQSSANNITTLGDAELNGGIIRTYTADIGTFAVTGLSAAQTYYFNVIAKDATNNRVVYTAVTATTKAAAPAGFSGSAVTAGGSSLSWTPSATVFGYLVVRRESTAVAWAPTDGTGYYRGQDLGSNTVVVQVGSGAVVGDYELTAGTTYHYAVYAYTSAYVYSAKAVSSVAAPSTSFMGLDFAFLKTAPRTVDFRWRPKTGCTTDDFSLFSGATTGSQNFAGSSDADVSDCTTNMSLALPGAAGSDRYSVLREIGGTDSNTVEFGLKLASGSHHRMSFSRQFNGMDPLEMHNEDVEEGVVDSWGNFIFYREVWYMVYVLCHENTTAPYCRGRTVGRVYSLAGAGGKGDGSSGEPAVNAAVGVISAIEVDLHGNIYLADADYPRVRVVCHNTHALAGFCNGKKYGYVYHFAGTGTSGDGAQSATPTSSAVGTVNDIAVDRSGNVYLADSTNSTTHRIRAICLNPEVGIGYCAGKTAGTSYRMLAVAEADGAGSVAFDAGTAATQVGDIMSIAVDSYGNIIFGDYAYRRLRAICFNVTAPGFCSGKTDDYIYRVHGDGTLANGGDGDTVGAGAMRQPWGIVADAFGNIYFTQRSAGAGAARAVCYDNAVPGACNGEDEGEVHLVYSLAGEISDLSMDRYGNFYWLAVQTSNGQLQVYCSSVAAGVGYCAGKTVATVYSLNNTSTTTSTIDGVPAYFNMHEGITGVSSDVFGNVWFLSTASSSADNVLGVICKNAASTGFCNGKTVGASYNVYTNAGTALTAVTTDSLGNVYFATGITSDRKVYVYCNSLAAGPCSDGLVINTRNFLMGQGATATDDVDPASAHLGEYIRSIAVDQNYNVYVGSGGTQNYRIRAYCFTVAAGTGFCAGKATAKKVYWVVGTGAAASGGDGVAVDSAGGTYGIDAATNGLAVDSGNNVYFGGDTHNLLRVICYSDTAPGFCDAAGKIGNVYHLVGSGAAGDAADDAVRTSAIGRIKGIDVDSGGNVFWADDTYYRVRALCYTSQGACTGKTSGKIYRLLGTGATGDAPSNVAGSTAAIGTPNYDAVALGAGGEVLFSDSSHNVIRLVLP